MFDTTPEQAAEYWVSKKERRRAVCWLQDLSPPKPIHDLFLFIQAVADSRGGKLTTADLKEIEDVLFERQRERADEAFHEAMNAACGPSPFFRGP